MQEKADQPVGAGAWEAGTGAQRRPGRGLGVGARRALCLSRHRSLKEQGPSSCSGGSGPRLQGAHVHTGQAEPGLRQLLACAVLVEPDVEEEVARVEEEEGPQAGGLA